MQFLKDIYQKKFLVLSKAYRMNQAQQKTNFLTPLALVDVAVRRLIKKRTVFFAGLSKVGKSTFFSHFFNVKLLGAQNGIETTYQATDINQVSEFKDEIKSTTMIPKVLQRKNAQNGLKTTYVDLAGFNDKRTFKEVFCVSYSLKKVFQTVQNCQFVFFIANNHLLTQISQLNQSILRFTKIFQFSKLNKQQKKQFLDSVTLIITRAKGKCRSEDYAKQIAKKIIGIKDPTYKQIGQQDKKIILEFLLYFSQYQPSKICLFPEAVHGKPAPACQLQQKYLSKRKFFQLGKYRDQFRKKQRKTMIELPFKKDFCQLIDLQQKESMKTKCDQRLNSFQTFVKILVSFFKKAMKYQNIYGGNISFIEQFKEMKKYNHQFNIYPAKFKQITYEQETKLRSVFNEKSMDKKLDMGIRLVKRVFQLFELFKNTPIYTQNEDVNLSFSEWMTQFKIHIITIITIFRDSFCKNFKQQQLLLQFLFIAVRGCSELTMIFEILDQNKNQKSSNLKQIFKSALQNKQLSTLQNQFVQYFSKNKSSILKTDKDEFQIYRQYIFDYKQRSNNDEIIKGYIKDNFERFNDLYKAVLEMNLKYCSKSEDKILALFNNLKQHIAKSKMNIEDLLEQQDDQDYEYNQKQNPKIKQNNSTFKYILSNLGHEIMEMNRQGDIKNDVFSTERIQQLISKKQTQIKKQFNLQQASCARHIFIYINDVKSVIDSYQKTLNNIDQQNTQQRIVWLQGYADYCLQNGRKHQAIQLYQQIIQICYLKNNIKKHDQIQQKIIKLPQNYIKLQKDFILKIKQNPMINPITDNNLQDLVNQIQDMFINPYQEYICNQKVQRVRKMSNNQKSKGQKK